MTQAAIPCALYSSEGADLVHYAVDSDQATVQKKATVRVPAQIQYAWPHPTNRWLYVASSNVWEVADPSTAKTHHLTAFAIGRDGALTPHGEPVQLPFRPIHNTVDATGRFAITCYNKPDTITVHHIEADGRIGALVPQPHYLAGGIFPHQVRLLPSNRHVVQVARGHFSGANKPEDPGALLTFSFNDGVLKLVDTVSPNGGYGFGPRHLDFHPTRPWTYVSLERQRELHMFTIENDRFSEQPKFVKSMLAEPQNVRPRQLGGTVHVHPDGRTVYAANRADWPVQHEGQTVFGGGENTIAVFAIDQTTGEPKPIQYAQMPGIHVRCFALDPTGRILIAAMRNDMNVLENGKVRHLPRMLTVFRVGADGRLTQANNYDVHCGNNPAIWTGVVALPA